MNNIQAVAALKRVLASPPLVNNKQQSICASLYDILKSMDYTTRPSDCEDLVTYYATSWPYYSGNPTFPIPGGEDSFTHCLVNNSFWDDIQGEYRTHLVNHMITKLEHEIQITTKREILQALTTINDTINTTGTPPNIKAGICSNANNLCNSDIVDYCTVSTTIGKYATQWPYFSGDQEYPIPGGEDAFWDNLNNKSFWEDSQLFFRRSLIYFITTTITTELKNER